MLLTWTISHRPSRSTAKSRWACSMRILYVSCHFRHLEYYFITSGCVWQRSRHLQRVVKRCAMRWKQRALCKSREEQKVHGKPPKKSVTFCFTTPGQKSISSSDSVEQEAEDGGLLKLWVLDPDQLWVYVQHMESYKLSLLFFCRIPPRMPRRQPRRREELFGSPQTVLSNNK